MEQISYARCVNRVSFFGISAWSGLCQSSSFVYDSGVAIFVGDAEVICIICTKAPTTNLKLAMREVGTQHGLANRLVVVVPTEELTLP